MTNSYLLVTNARQMLKPKDSLIALMEVLMFCSLSAGQTEFEPGLGLNHKD